MVHGTGCLKENFRVERMEHVRTSLTSQWYLEGNIRVRLAFREKPVDVRHLIKGGVLTDELVSEGIVPQNTKIEKELVVCTDAGLGELGVAKRLTSHSTPPDFPSRIITYTQGRQWYS